VLKQHEVTSPTFWQLQATGWIGLYALLIVTALTRVPYSTIAILSGTLRCVLWFIASCGLRFICRSLLRHPHSWLQLELRVFGWCLLAGASAPFLLVSLAALYFHQFGWRGATRDSVSGFVLMLLWCNLYFSIKQWQRSTQERERLLRAEADAREARLSALRYQLNPHFLFNSLNAASTLALEGDVPAATHMLAQIADLLRTSLDTQPALEVPLAEEMVFTQRYLAIEQTRLEDRLQVDLAIAAETLEAAVPSMLLQPLVENAIRHGIAPLVDGGRVTIQSRLQDSQLRILIKNTGSRVVPASTRAGGIGLTNTAERLKTLYGAGHRLDLQWPDTGGCEVLIEIPFRRVVHGAEGASCGY
jgi:two-component system, LytTR family, sensor kinase